MDIDSILAERLNDIDFVTRFKAKVRAVESGCHEWQAAKDPNGYGRFSIGLGLCRSVLAHRVAWMIDNGPLASTIYVCHKCDNPPCVNAEHIFAGGSSANMLDASRKGRLSNRYHVQGTEHPLAVLTPQLVVEIRRRYDAGDNCASIARTMAISYNAVNAAARRVTWKQVS